MSLEKKPVWVLVVAAVLLLALGGIGGFLIRGTSAVPEPTGESWRLDYACPMAEQLENTKGSADGWEEMKLSDPDLDRVAIIGAAIGGMTGASSLEGEDLRLTGGLLIRGISTMNPEMVVEGLEQVTSYCAAR